MTILRSAEHLPAGDHDGARHRAGQAAEMLSGPHSPRPTEHLARVEAALVS